PAKWAMFQCGVCWAVLGDSQHFCAQEDRRLGLIVCYRVTNNVTWEDSLMIGLEGALQGCSYFALFCQSCGSNVGFILYSSSSDLAYLRGLFCFFKKSIMCYVLEKHITMQASKVNFPSVTLEE
ncbi:MS18B protein, partial [Turnix velox]|nr:MS18B protein [Turnix velox]